MNTGGPAFPVSALIYNDDGNDPTTIIHDGMELRDYFAAKAMQAIFSNPEITDTNKVKNWIAISAYSMADEMLKVRKE